MVQNSHPSLSQPYSSQLDNSSSGNLRSQFADQILARLQQEQSSLRANFQQRDRIPSFYLDNLLNEADASEIHAVFPNPQEMRLLKSLREEKYVGIQMDRFNPLLEEIIYAFQDPRIVELISEITGITPLIPDHLLYAGGISVMGEGNYLNPHLDNSHNRDHSHYRVLNLLYYISPNWKPEYGGNLELWDNGVKRPCRTIDYKFNRLVVMTTDRTSWHSVNPIQHHQRRCCVSNYYFSPKSPNDSDYFHVTTFRGRPEQPLRDLMLQGDSWLRSSIPEGLKHRVRKPGFYQK